MTAISPPLALVESPSGRHCEWQAIFKKPQCGNDRQYLHIMNE